MNPSTQVNTKSGQSKERRYVNIVDEGGSSIQVSLWGLNAANSQNYKEG